MGARRDPAWGPTLMVGLGGIFTEALHDVKFLPADASESEITAALRALKGAKLLDGYRGRPAANVAKLAEAAARIGALMLATPELEEIDVNPLIVSAKGAVAVDALLVASDPN